MAIDAFAPVATEVSERLKTVLDGVIGAVFGGTAGAMLEFELILVREIRSALERVERDLS